MCQGKSSPGTPFGLGPGPTRNPLFILFRVQSTNITGLNQTQTALRHFLIAEHLLPAQKQLCHILQTNFINVLWSNSCQINCLWTSWEEVGLNVSEHVDKVRKCLCIIHPWNIQYIIRYLRRKQEYQSYTKPTEICGLSYVSAVQSKGKIILGEF